jgi:two-component system response regulator AlgR
VSEAAPLRVLIVDDEELARMRLRSLVAGGAEPRAAVAGEAADTAQALAWLSANDCDLVLLDVQMPGRDGVQLAAELRARERPPAVVFVTAHAEHALRAFELEAVDYLTKPVRRERLQAALQRVAQRLALQRRQAPEEGQAPAQDAGPMPAQAGGVIVASDRGRIVRVPVDEVLYLKAELKYVTLRTAQRTHVLDESLADLESRLGGRFLRVHRNALVARDAVRALERRALAAGEGDEGDGNAAGEGWAVRIAPVDEWLAVSRRQLAAVREALVAAAR